ncbi:MAG: phosphoribosylglycinamide formyltransferase [Verrucomicrobia bacterium]|nr:phosphoribosylglycinamide formyltransferase [Verrucomicrobiota bacterium]
MRPLRLGILGSGKGTNFLALARSIQEGTVPAEVVQVGSDQSKAGILESARGMGLPVFVCRPGAFQTKLEPEIEEELAEALAQAGVELVVLAGYMRVVKAPLLRRFGGRMINIHPSLLPAFPGLKAWEQALRAGVKETGCTVHWVNEVVDGGGIIRQAKVPVQVGDTAEALHAKIQMAEHRLLPEVVRELAMQKIPWLQDPRSK